MFAYRNKCIPNAFWNFYFRIFVYKISRRILLFRCDVKAFRYSF